MDLVDLSCELDAVSLHGPTARSDPAGDQRFAMLGPNRFQVVQ